MIKTVSARPVIIALVAVSIFGLATSSAYAAEGHTLAEVLAIHKEYPGHQWIYQNGNLRVGPLKIVHGHWLHVGANKDGVVRVLLNQGWLYYRLAGERIYRAPDNVFLVDLTLKKKSVQKSKTQLAPGIYLDTIVDSREVSNGKIRLVTEVTFDIAEQTGKVKLVDTEVDLFSKVPADVRDALRNL